MLLDESVVAVQGAAGHQANGPLGQIDEREGHNDAEDPEPEEGVDALVEQVEREYALHGVDVLGAELVGLDVADGDARKYLRVGLLHEIGLAAQYGLQHLEAVEGVTLAAQQRVHHVDLHHGVEQVERLDHHVAERQHALAEAASDRPEC